MSEIVIIFKKAPVLGKVKTRLAESLGDLKALEIYKALLKKTATELSQLKITKHVYYTPEIIADEYSGDQVEKFTQVQGDLGEKLKAAFLNAFGSGASKVLAIGTDCLELETSHIKEALEALDHFDVVLGPANDGGYYLIGMNEYQPLFENMPWSQPDLMQATKNRLEEHQLEHKTLVELTDVDYEDDLPENWEHSLMRNYS